MTQKHFAFSPDYENLTSQYPYPKNGRLPQMNAASPRKCLTGLECLQLQKYAYEQLIYANKVSNVYKGVSAVVKALIIIIGLNTGLRITELTSTCWGDFVIDSNCVFVRNGKGQKTRYVYYPPSIVNPAIIDAHALFSKWKLPNKFDDWVFYSVTKENSYSQRALQLCMKKIITKLNIRNHLSPHSLRHSFAVNFYLASGKDIKAVQEQLGHTDIKTTQIYLSTLMPTINETLRKMYPDFQKSRCQL
ncbi:tyrosine-type recombinase/integrase [Candidatus Uabimicrobium sp. HlEnr_7]|uniref:tyrosine-type recombinase/integrase n=1 Tax=Candidatus Uabimicrobium helgolandensis TaxID=3095367 RepID=UPI0035571942